MPQVLSTNSRASVAFTYPGMFLAVGLTLVPNLLLISAGILLFSMGASIATGTSPSPNSERIPEGFVSIFPGDQLEGWYARPHMDPREFDAMNDAERQAQKKKWADEANDHWRVEGNELINDGSGPYLVTQKDYTDYELVVDYRTVAKADSGIYLKGNPQIQIWDYTETSKFGIGSDLGSGGLWNNSKGAAGKNPFVLADAPLGQWNHFLIRQIGARTTVFLNDQLVVDHAIMENYWARDEPLFSSGPVILQTHGGEIRFKNLAIRELSADQSNEHLRNHQGQSFTSIFDGKTLDGWQGATDSYVVDHGVVRCKKGTGGNLLTQKEYANFVARIEFRLPPGGNNGIAIRAPLQGDTAYVGMCELQILDDPHPKFANLDPRQYHGSVYGVVAAKRGFLRPTGQWNFQQITVNGSTIKVELNGNVIVNADVATVDEYAHAKAHPGINRTSGFFGLAGHHDPVEFRNLSMKELP